MLVHGMTSQCRCSTSLDTLTFIPKLTEKLNYNRYYIGYTLDEVATAKCMSANFQRRFFAAAVPPHKYSNGWCSISAHTRSRKCEKEQTHMYSIAFDEPFMFGTCPSDSTHTHTHTESETHTNSKLTLHKLVLAPNVFNLVNCCIKSVANWKTISKTGKRKANV